MLLYIELANYVLQLVFGKFLLISSVFAVSCDVSRGMGFATGGAGSSQLPPFFGYLIDWNRSRFLMIFICNWELLLLFRCKQGVLPILSCSANGLHACYEDRRLVAFVENIIERALI